MTDIDEIARRPEAYLAGTGVPQLASGLVFFLLGSSILIPRVFPGPSLDYRLIVQIAGTCLAGAVFWGARSLKRRVVFPRGGYVEPLRRPSRRVVLIATLAPVLALGIVAVAWPGHLPRLDSRLVAPGLALTFAVLCLVSGWRQKSASMMWFGACLMCLAPVLWRLPVNNYEQLATLQVGAGAALAAGGAIRLRSFLKTNPGPVEASNE